MTPRLIEDLVCITQFSIAFTVFMRFVADVFHSKNSTEKYLKQSSNEKWFYASYLNSYCYSIILTYLGIQAAFFDCHPEAKSQHTGTTVFTNAYCRDNPSENQLRGLTALVGFLLGDLVI